MKQIYSPNNWWGFWQKQILLMIISVVSSVSFAGPKTPKALLENSLVYCTKPENAHLVSQQLVPSNDTNVITEQIYDKLIEYDQRNHTFKPSLAESFSISNDGLVITLNLRRDVAFQHTAWFTPSRFFNEEDVIFSLHRMLAFADILPTVAYGEANLLTQKYSELIWRKGIADVRYRKVKDNIELSGFTKYSCT